MRTFVGLFGLRLQQIRAEAKRARLGAAVVLLTLFVALSAQAKIITTFDLSKVTFADGGKATGSFTLDLTPSPFAPLLVSADVTTTSGGLFGGAHYTVGNVFEILNDTPFGSFTPTFDAWDVDLVNLGTGSSLVFSMIEPATASGLPFPSTTASIPVIATSSYPGELWPGHFRKFVGGSLDPVATKPPSTVPEPETFAIFGISLLVFGFMRNLRRFSR